MQAIEALQDLSGDLLAACFPGQSLGEVLAQLKRVDETMLQSVIGNVLLAAPAHLMRFAAKLTGIDEETLMSDPNIGLDGLMEILNAWAEVNRIGDFAQVLKGMQNTTVR